MTPNRNQRLHAIRIRALDEVDHVEPSRTLGQIGVSRSLDPCAGGSPIRDSLRSSDRRENFRVVRIDAQFRKILGQRAVAHREERCLFTEQPSML